MVDLLSWLFNILIFSPIISISLSFSSTFGEISSIFSFRTFTEFLLPFLIAKSSSLCLDFICGNLYLYFFILKNIYLCIWASLVAQLVKNPAVWETWVQSLGWEDPLEKGTATHPSILGLPWWLRR